MPSMLRAATRFALFASAMLSSTGRAQGLPEVRTGIALPTPQAAAVEDATALLVNPAGIALVEGLELNLGAFVRTDGTTGQSDVDGAMAFTPLDGIGIGVGTGLTMADSRAPRLRLSGAFAAGDRGFSSGIALHAVSALAGGGQPDLLVDLGIQARPTRWLAFAAGLENLGAQGTGPASARAGLSLRPLHEAVTVGLDVRAVPGSRDLFSPRYASELVLVPAAALRVDLGGIALTLGGSIANLGAVVPAPPAVEVLAGIELNGNNVGVWAAGGADGILQNAQRGVGGARLRTSSAQWTPIFADSGRWLSLALTGDGVPVDNTDGGVMARLLADEPGAVALLAALDSAAKDPSVEGVVVRLKGLSLGWGRLAELRAVITQLRTGGKKVIVHLDGGDDAEVYVASAADQVYLTPAGTLELNGLRADMLYFADTLAKVGLEAEAVSAGLYKSAPREFTANEPSPEELEVEGALLDEAFASLTDMIAKDRGIDVAAVKSAIDKGGLTAQAAVEAKIIDGIAYEDELADKAAKLAGRAVRLEERFLDTEERDVRWDAHPRIALIPVTGTIGMGGSGGFFGGGPGAEDIMQALEQASRDDGVKAIVLRIDSPGGDALASDLIWRAVMKAREKKPIVASMGDVAASGGYYVAAGAHAILAERNTVTGSIGVFGLLFNAERLADDIGVRSYSMKRGALPGPSVLRALSDAERASLQVSVDATYERFLDAVISGRGEASGVTKDALRASADGHVWTGAQALERKLVDKIGGVLDALDEARARAGIGADEEIVLDVITGTDDDLIHLAQLAHTLASGFGPGRSAAAALRLLLGDPAALAFALAHEGKPVAMAPMHVRIR
jgi:protease-4